MGAAGIMYFIEFFVDKTPGVDTGWDTIHTFIRIPAGAMLAAGAVGDLNPAVEIAAALLGGGLAAGTHATKAGTRVLINTSPGAVQQLGRLDWRGRCRGRWRLGEHQPSGFLLDCAGLVCGLDYLAVA